ncbi:hypothetical protein [Domibacillus epiphyticus]|uniref:Uncharacterized protein n=1 Tax=Domibacillus epiphyticus TaxID=1714355 RepID=A0A1V2A8K3_9BACI|nr:hypothetical protein [Domibacillus epiphyticus]OMP67192.1 hypothetical protein BTO28_07620 [Domibacillus epiphyticus]
MNINTVEQIKKYYGMEKNKEHLIQLMKQGDFLKCCEDKGYIYAVKIGENKGMDVMLKVALKNNEVEIMSVFEQQQIGAA